jgi:hypothetical protein
MSPVFLFLDLLLLVVGFPLLWTFRDLSWPIMSLATAGGPAFPAARAHRAAAAPPARDVPTARERRLMHDILRHWHELCPDDVDALDALLAAPDSHLATIAGSPNNLFWASLAELGWARPVLLPDAFRKSGMPAEMFVLTGEGARLLPDFRRRYDLVFGTSYAAGRSRGALADRFQ